MERAQIKSRTIWNNWSMKEDIILNYLCMWKQTELWDSGCLQLKQKWAWHLPATYTASRRVLWGIAKKWQAESHKIAIFDHFTDKLTNAMVWLIIWACALFHIKSDTVTKWLMCRKTIAIPKCLTRCWLGYNAKCAVQGGIVGTMKAADKLSFWVVWPTEISHTFWIALSNFLPFGHQSGSTPFLTASSWIWGQWKI